MVSTAVTAGIVQVTHEGDPIILMADAQTTGGYPRIARICAADISLLAQCRPGTKIQFREIGEEESVMRYNRMVEAMKKVKVGLGNLD
jgi:antagonist of KipI